MTSFIINKINKKKFYIRYFQKENIRYPNDVAERNGKKTNYLNKSDQWTQKFLDFRFFFCYLKF